MTTPSVAPGRGEAPTAFTAPTPEQAGRPKIANISIPTELRDELRDTAKARGITIGKLSAAMIRHCLDDLNGHDKDGGI